jgi:hypothetical protein
MDSQKQTPATPTRCSKYNELCSKEKMCGDCSADEYDKECYSQSVEEYRLDRTFELLNLFHEKSAAKLNL